MMAANKMAATISTERSCWISVAAKMVAFVAFLMVFCAALKLYCNCGSVEEQNKECVAAVGQVGSLYVLFKADTGELCMEGFSQLDRGEEVDDDNSLRAQDDSLASGSNTTCLHSDDLTVCNVVKQLTGMILFFVVSAFNFSCRVISGLHRFLDNIFSNEGHRKARAGGSPSGVNYLTVILLILCFSKEISACGNSSIKLSESNRSSIGFTSQDLQTREESSSSQDEFIIPKNCVGKKPIQLMGKPNSSATPAFSFSLGNSEASAVHEVCPTTRMMKQLHVHAPDIIPVQSIVHKKETSGMFDMVKMYSSKGGTHKVRLDDPTRQRSRKSFGRTKMALWISCVVIALLLLVAIPYLCPYLGSHHVRAPHTETHTDQSSSHEMVYSSNPLTGLSLDYKQASTPGISGTDKDYAAAYFTADKSASGGHGFNETINARPLEEGMLEDRDDQVFARQSSDAVGINTTKLIVGLSCQLPVQAPDKMNEDDSGDVLAWTSKPTLSEDAKDSVVVGYTKNGKVSKNIEDFKDIEKSVHDSERVEEYDDNEDHHDPPSSYCPEDIYISIGTSINYRDTPIKGFSSMPEKDMCF